MVLPDAPIALAGAAARFVSRGGEKLDAALERLDVEVAARCWLDAGASTGGFTDCLLQRGARAVVAYDVGYGQLHWRLRNDPRVTVIERANVRHVSAEDLPWRPDGVVADLSFISLTLVLEPIVRAAAPDADLILLVKPQFEAGRDAVGRSGVVRDPEVWRSAMERVAAAASGLGRGLVGAVASPLPGPAGNREFFLHLRAGGGAAADAIERAVEEAS